MKKNHSLILTLLVAGSFLMSACAPNVSPNTYVAGEAGVVSKVVPGTIIGKRKIKIDARSGAGGLAGVAGGAAAGSAIGNNDRSHVAGAVGGAVIGGIVGNAIDKTINSHKGYEYIIKLKSGSTISVAQVQELEFDIHQPVLVIYGAMTRIVPDDGAGAAIEIKKPDHHAEKKAVKKPKMNNSVI